MTQIKGLDFNRIFALSFADDRKALHVTVAKDEAWEPFVRNKELRLRLVKGEISLSLPLTFVPSQVSGQIPRDLITTEFSNIRLLSERVVQCFRDFGFTGWSTFPVVVYGKDDVVVPGYSGLAVTGRCGPIDGSLSVRMPRPEWIIGPRDRDVMMGLYFNPETWDGSDIFTPNGGHVFVVEKVKLALEKMGATNFAFISLDKLENQLASLRMKL